MRGQIGELSDFYPDYDSLDPYASYDRGYYFDESYVYLPPFDTTNDPLLILPPDFSIAFWVRPEDDGLIISKQDLSFNY